MIGNEVNAEQFLAKFATKADLASLAEEIVAKLREQISDVPAAFSDAGKKATKRVRLPFSMPSAYERRMGPKEMKKRTNATMKALQTAPPGAWLTIAEIAKIGKSIFKDAKLSSEKSGVSRWLAVLARNGKVERMTSCGKVSGVAPWTLCYRLPVASAAPADTNTASAVSADQDKMARLVDPAKRNSEALLKGTPATAPKAEPPGFTAYEVAKRLGVTVRDVRFFARTGGLSGEKMADRSFRFNEADVAKFTKFLEALK